jgi:SAM-dependent methyltransferase
LNHRTPADWSSQLYIEHAEVYVPVLEKGLETAPAEAKGISRIFHRYGVSKKGRLLDVSCGIGRHSVELGKLGYRVIGLDPSPFFLARARLLALHEGVSKNVRFVRGNFSSLARILARFDRSFDGMIIMDNSIGVTGKDEDDRRLFADLLGRASSGAVLVVEIFDRDAVAKRYQRYMVERFPHNLVRIWKSLSPPGSRINEAEWTFYRERQARDLKHILTLRVSTRHYSEEELQQLVQAAGWCYLDCFGSLTDLHEFTVDDYRAFLVFRKATRTRLGALRPPS